MIVDLIDKLIDRCIQLAARREQDRRALFEEFVAPAYVTFEAVHDDYLDTFREYRRILTESSAPLTANHPVFDKLRADSLFSQGKRGKLNALQPLLTEPELGGFITAISRYLTLSTTRLSGLHESAAPELDPSAPPLLNRIRGRLRTDWLSQIARGGSFVAPRVPSAVFVEVLDRILESLQSHYSEVASEYESLKKTLLRPRLKKSSKGSKK